MEARQAYFRAVEAVEGGTCSPGGAAAILRITRQGVWKLISTGRVRAWEFYEGRGKVLPEMVDVSVRDLVEHGVRTGRLAKPEDAGISGKWVRSEIERALGVDSEQLAR